MLESFQEKSSEENLMGKVSFCFQRILKSKKRVRMKLSQLKIKWSQLMGTRIVETREMDILLDELLGCKIIVDNTNLMNPFTFVYFLTLIRERIKKGSGIEGRNN